MKIYKNSESRSHFLIHLFFILLHFLPSRKPLDKLGSTGVGKDFDSKADLLFMVVIIGGFLAV